MNPVEVIARRVRERFPAAAVVIDPPGDPGGHWFADIELEGQGLTLEWRPATGFGLTTDVGQAALGEGPDEVVDDADAAWQRIVYLLSTRASTVPPSHLILPRLRESRSLTQAEVAKAMNARQSDVSKMERRSDMLVSNLRRLVNAMGGHLEIRAVFPDGLVNVIELNQGRSNDDDERETG